MDTNLKESTNKNLTVQELDGIKLNSWQYLKGILSFILFSGIAIFVFFVNVTIGDESNIVFVWIFNFFVNILGNFGLWLILFIMIVNMALHVWAKYIYKGDKTSKLYQFYKGENFIYTILYAVGIFYMSVFTFNVTFVDFYGPNIFVGNHTGGTVISHIVLPVGWIILVGAVFMPFLVNFGLLEFFGTLLDPLMRPIFKLPGKASLNAITSMFTAATLAVLITSKLYKQNVYTARETVILATSFCTVSIGFTHLVVATAGMSHMFVQIYTTVLVVCFILVAIMIRIPPLSRKSTAYYNGIEQTEEEVKADAKFTSKTINKSVDRALKRAYTAKNPLKEVIVNCVDAAKIIPQVTTLISAVGISALILAEYTPIFQWLGVIFIPIISLLQIPDAALIAPSLPVGLAEMFLPVLLIASNVDIISEQARFFITTVSLVQIIFFAETASVMIAAKVPISVKELVICFFQRTLIAMPLVAIATHILIP